jgi:NTE family protein
LHALQHDIGWDPNSADVILGTSAGSIVGGLLRAGLTTDDLAAWGASVDARLAGGAARATLDQIGASRHRIAPSIPWPHGIAATLRRSMLRPSRARVSTAAISMLPDGWIDAGTDIERVEQLLPEWPEGSLWVTAVQQSDGRRVVFGRDDIDVTPGRAIAASCAIPGVFTPVTIAGKRYIDGGSYSPTNADLLVHAGVDAALVLSPMSGGPNSLTWRPDRPLRALCSRRLAAECRQLADLGIQIHVVEPDRATLRAMGLNALDRSRASGVVRDSFLAAGAQVAGSRDLADLLAQHRGTRARTTRA